MGYNRPHCHQSNNRVSGATHLTGKRSQSHVRLGQVDTEGLTLISLEEKNGNRYFTAPFWVKLQWYFPCILCTPSTMKMAHVLMGRWP